MTEFVVGETVIVERHGAFVRKTYIMKVGAKGVMLADYPKFWYPPNCLEKVASDGFALRHITRAHKDAILRDKIRANSLIALTTEGLLMVAHMLGIEDPS